MLKVADDGVVTPYTGIPDKGQGSHTVMAMIAAEVLGVEPEDIRIVGGDSDITPFDWGAFSQRGTFTTGNAVKLAAEDARGQLAGIVGTLLGVAATDLEFARRRVWVRGEAQDTPGRSFNSPRPPGSLAYSFGAQVAEVEVDPESGAVRVLKVTAAHDLGRALNKLPRTYELPEVEYLLVETIDPYGPFGAKEVGEGPIVVTMAAVANAVGEMVPQIPMTPWRLLRVIRHRRNHGLAPAD